MTCSQSSARIFVAVLCSATLLSSGCGAVRRKPSVGWSKAAQVRPNLPATSANGDAAAADPGPELKLVIPTPPSVVTATHGNPPRPRLAANSPAENEGSAKPEAPTIVPELTAEEATAAKRQTSQSLAVAERNLEVTKGKNLSEAQMDLASKVRSFVAEALDASRTGDWIRARDLARKAQVLSEELAKSL